MGQKSTKSYRETLRQLDPSCFYCGRMLGKKAATLEHVTPQSRGGQDSPGNLVVCCNGCNKFKGSLNATEFLELLTGMVDRLRAYVDAEPGSTG